MLREEYNNQYAKTVDAQERQNLAVHSNTKRSIYLQAGEDVTPPEYYVIGLEMNGNRTSSRQGIITGWL